MTSKRVRTHFCVYGMKRQVAIEALYADGLFICRFFDVLSPMVMRPQAQQNKDNITQAVNLPIKNEQGQPSLSPVCSNHAALCKVLMVSFYCKTLIYSDTLILCHMVYPAESELWIHFMKIKNGCHDIAIVS